MDKQYNDLYHRAFIDEIKSKSLWEYELDLKLQRSNLDDELISEIPNRILNHSYSKNSTRAVVENIYISITPMFVKHINNEKMNVYFKDVISKMKNLLESIVNEERSGEFTLIRDNIYTCHGIGRYKFGFQILDEQHDIKYRIYLKHNDKGDHKPIFAVISAKQLHLTSIEQTIEELEKDIKVIFKHFNEDIDKMDKQISRIDICNHNNIYSVDDFVYKRDTFRTRIFKGTEIYDWVNNKKSYSYVRIGNGDIKVRCYNKAKEIIELQNKVYFFQMWYEIGLVSEKDYYTYTLAYKISSDYEFSIRVAMILTSNRIDKEKKIELLESIRKKTSNRIDYVDRLITKNNIEKIRPIVNVEFEAHNKFLRTVKMSDMSDMRELNVMIKNLDQFYRYLTNHVFFQATQQSKCSRKKNIASKWMLIIDSKIKNIETTLEESKLKVIRQYNHKMTCERLSSRLINSMCAYYGAIEDNASEISSTNIIKMMEKIKSSSFITQSFIDVNDKVQKQRSKINKISNLNMQKSGL